MQLSSGSGGRRGGKGALRRAGGGTAVTTTGTAVGEDDATAKYYQPLLARLGNVVEMRVDGAKGKSLHATTALKPAQVVFGEEPMASHQFLDNALLTGTCAHCARFIGTLQQQLDRLVTVSIPLFHTAMLPDEVVAELHRDYNRRYPHLAPDTVLPGVDAEAAMISPVVPCQFGCGAEYCSQACHDRALRQYHLLLCPAFPDDDGVGGDGARGDEEEGDKGAGGEEEEGEEASPATINAALLFRNQSLVSNEMLYYAGKAVGRVLEAWVRNGNDLPAAMRPWSSLHSAPWWTVFALRDAGEAKKAELDSDDDEEDDDDEAGEGVVEGHGHSHGGHSGHCCGGHGHAHTDAMGVTDSPEYYNVSKLAKRADVVALRQEKEEEVGDSIIILRALVRRRLPHIVRLLQSEDGVSSGGGDGEKGGLGMKGAYLATVDADTKPTSPCGAGVGAGVACTEGAVGGTHKPSALSLSDWENDLLFHPAVYQQLVAALDLNSIEYQIDSPLRDYLRAISALSREEKGDGIPSPYAAAMAEIQPLLHRLEKAERGRIRLPHKLMKLTRLWCPDLVEEGEEEEEEEESEGGAGSSSDEEASGKGECGGAGATSGAAGSGRRAGGGGEGGEGEELTEERINRLVPIATGSCVFAVISCMNHSCEPNAMLTHAEGDRRAVVLAKRAIEAGEELCINYVDVEQCGVARRADLAHYGFYCRCARCVTEEAAGRGGPHAGMGGTEVTA